MSTPGTGLRLELEQATDTLEKELGPEPERTCGTPGTGWEPWLSPFRAIQIALFREGQTLMPWHPKLARRWLESTMPIQGITKKEVDYYAYLYIPAPQMYILCTSGGQVLMPIGGGISRETLQTSHSCHHNSVRGFL